jgi:hypothetical protein
MKWHRLDRHQSKNILQRIATVADPHLFSEMSSEAQFGPLSFYEEYMIYRITNYATLPSFSLDFLSDGESFFLLDGSPSPITIVNARGSLHLNENNVMDYADFYLSNIRGDEGDIYIIRDTENLPFIDSLEFDQQADLKKKHVEPEVLYDDAKDHYVILTNLFYGGTLLNAGIIVKHTGEIEIEPRDMIMSGAQNKIIKNDMGGEAQQI